MRPNSRLIFCLLVYSTFVGCSYQESPKLSCAPASSCISRYLCTEPVDIQYGKGQIVPRSGDSEYVSCPDPSICCKDELIIENPQMLCGLSRAPSPTSPFVVAIFVGPAPETFIGTGSLLAPSIVLTAANLVASRRTEDLVVHGDISNITAHHQKRFVDQKIVHDDFNVQNARFNIALLALKESLTNSLYMSPVCMPRPHEFDSYDHCFVAGWQSGQRGGLQYRKVDQSVLEHATCQQQLRKTLLGRHYELHESFVCTAEDLCIGNSGSPLFCALKDMPQRYYQLGVMSFCIDCHSRNVPVVFTSVIKVQRWIREILKSLRINTNFYTSPLTHKYLEWQKA